MAGVVGGADQAPTGTVVLVDFNNIAPAATVAVRDAPLRDALELVGLLIRNVTAPSSPPPRARDAVEVDCRLYDGWVDRAGQAMEKYRRVHQHLSVLSGLEQGVRIKPMLVRSLACHPAAPLIATYKNGAQKMVDQMLAQDALFFVETRAYERIVLLANDDDYVPVALTLAVRWHTPMTWIRRRAAAENDALFQGTHINLIIDPAWQ